MMPPAIRKLPALSAIQPNKIRPRLKAERTARGTVKARPNTKRVMKPVKICPNNRVCPNKTVINPKTNGSIIVA